MAGDGEVGPVAHPQLGHVGEEVVDGVPGEDVRQAGLDADADQREPALGAPRLVLRQLLVAELDAGPLVRAVGVRTRQRHRHVEVVGTAGTRALEDRHHEARVHRVHHVRRAVPADRVGHGPGVGGVDAVGDQPLLVRVALLHGGDRALRPSEVVVGHDQRLEERSPGRDAHERISDPTRTYQQNPHCASLPIEHPELYTPRNHGFRTIFDGGGKMSADGRRAEARWQQQSRTHRARGPERARRA